MRSTFKPLENRRKIIILSAAAVNWTLKCLRFWLEQHLSVQTMAMTDVFGGAKTGNTIHYAFLDKSFTCFDNYNSDWLATNSLQKLRLEISGVKSQTHSPLFGVSKKVYIFARRNIFFRKKCCGNAIYKSCMRLQGRRRERKKLKIYVMFLLVTKCVILLSFFSDQFSKLEKIQVVR